MKPNEQKEIYRQQQILEALDNEIKQTQEEVYQVGNENINQGNEPLTAEQQIHYLKKFDVLRLKKEIVKGGERETHRMIPSIDPKPEATLVRIGRRQLAEEGIVEEVQPEKDVFIPTLSFYNLYLEELKKS